MYLSFLWTLRGGGLGFGDVRCMRRHAEGERGNEVELARGEEVAW